MSNVGPGDDIVHLGRKLGTEWMNSRVTVARGVQFKDASWPVYDTLVDHKFSFIGVSQGKRFGFGSKNIFDIFKLSKMGSEVDCSGVSRAVWLVKVKQLYFRAFKLFQAVARMWSSVERPVKLTS